MPDHFHSMLATFEHVVSQFFEQKMQDVAFSCGLTVGCCMG